MLQLANEQLANQDSMVDGEENIGHQQPSEDRVVGAGGCYVTSLASRADFCFQLLIGAWSSLLSKLNTVAHGVLQRISYYLYGNHHSTSGAIESRSTFCITMYEK